MEPNNLHKYTNELKSTEPMPVLFLGHGSPMNAIEDNEFVNGWRETGRSLPTPAAVLCISAHWETLGTRVTAMKHPPTIHDFGGFPRALFEVQYPAPGSPELAGATRDLVKKTTVDFDNKWGLDHGAWSVIKHLYPEADVPVIEMSLDYCQAARYHFDLAKELMPLRRKGVLIIGSGNMVHNLAMVAWDRFNEDNYAYDWAVEAGSRMKEFILNGDTAQLMNYRSLGRAFDLAVPTPEHYLPLLYALALRGKNEKISIFNDKSVAGSLSMTCVRVDPD